MVYDGDNGKNIMYNVMLAVMFLPCHLSQPALRPASKVDLGECRLHRVVCSQPITDRHRELRRARTIEHLAAILEIAVKVSG